MKAKKMMALLLTAAMGMSALWRRKWKGIRGRKRSG